jgi:hypothetical protein
LNLVPGLSVPRAGWRMLVPPTLLNASTLLINIQGDYTPTDTRFAGD